MKNPGLSLYIAGMIIFLILELIKSYRAPTVSKLHRWITNVSLSAVNGIVYSLIYQTTIISVLENTKINKLGLLNTFSFPAWLKIILGVMILDFVIYVWHLLNHVIPFLWRFHQVHHSDINMDVSTANRFHLGELLLSCLLLSMY